MEPAPRVAPSYKSLDGKHELNRQRQSLVLMTPETLWEQPVTAAVGRVAKHSPLGAKRVLDAVGDRQKDAGSPFHIGSLDPGQLPSATGPTGACKERPHQIAHGGDNGGEIVAAIPETLVGGLVAKDEHQTDHDGQ